MEARRARAVGFRSVLHEASAKSTEYGGFPESSLGALGVSAEVSSVGAVSMRPRVAHASATERWLAGVNASESTRPSTLL